MSMDESDIYTDVQEKASLSSAENARAASQAVFTTLGERITVGEADDVGEQLPDELAAQLTNPDAEAADFSPDEFIHRVSDRTTLTDTDPERVTRAVFTVLYEHVRDDELDNLTEQLPPTYGQLLRNADISDETP